MTDNLTGSGNRKKRADTQMSRSRKKKQTDIKSRKTRFPYYPILMWTIRAERSVGT